MRLTLQAVCIVVWLGAAAGHCPNFCSGHGDCSFDRVMTCTCFSGWTGFDCSERSCPVGNAWVGHTTSTDGLHIQEVECSNMGACNRASGECTCLSGFEGLACNKMSCPNACNGHGQCMSMREAATTVDGRLLTVDTTYDNWDADMVFGCVCDIGFFGYDCSLRNCPVGDDPLTPGVDEVQEIQCTCDGACDGYFVITFRGSHTSRIAWNAVATVADEDPNVLTTGVGSGESLEAKLEAIRTITGVTVSVSSTNNRVCPADGSTSTSTITFNQVPGDLPELEVTSFLTGTATPTLSVIADGATGGSVDGTTEDSDCSNRGICDESRGICSCFAGFAASDGDGMAGDIPDCGYEDPAITDCPNACSGRGDCSGGPTYLCTCFEGFTGPDCSLRECPFGRAWFDEASGVDQAHQLARCSNMGRCDFSTGLCSCQSGFTGGACDRLDCPSAQALRPCNGRGRCLSNRQLALVGTTNGEFNGVAEVQEVTCPATAGTFTLSFRHSISDSIAFNAAEATVRAALEALPTLGLVEVNFLSSVTEACSATPNAFRITFLHDFGNLPPVEGVSTDVGALAVTEVTAGTRVTYGETDGLEDTWDADMLHGCFCDGYPDYGRVSSSEDFGFYEDYQCTSRSCPFGHDVLALEEAAVPTVQTVACTLAAGTFTLEFRTQVTADLAFDATAATVTTALEALDSIGSVTVAFTGAAACDNTGTDTFTVQFDTELGVLPLLKAEPDTHVSSDITVTETTPGTSTVSECAGRGTCDRTLGVCKCFTGFVSGDGFGAKGSRGDCGAQDLLFVAS